MNSPSIGDHSCWGRVTTALPCASSTNIPGGACTRHAPHPMHRSRCTRMVTARRGYTPESPGAGHGGAIAFLDNLTQVVEVEGGDVLDAWVDVVDRRRGPLAHAQLQQRLHRDLGGAREHRGKALFLRVGAKRVR